MVDEPPFSQPHDLADLSIEGVSKTFRTRAEPVQALSSVTLKVRRGSFVALIGPSGCGKSTLLRLVAGLEEPDHGVVLLRNETPHAFRARGELGIAFQDPALLPWRTVRRNVALPFQVLGKKARAYQQRIDDL